MARSTCNNNKTPPKGMKSFEVIHTTIKDSVGQYCGPGDMAILTEKAAKKYLKENHIRVALPDFDVEENNDTATGSESTGGKVESDPSEGVNKRRPRGAADA